MHLNDSCLFVMTQEIAALPVFCSTEASVTATAVRFRIADAISRPWLVIEAYLKRYCKSGCKFEIYDSQFRSNFLYSVMISSIPISPTNTLSFLFVTVVGINSSGIESTSF